MKDGLRKQENGKTCLRRFRRTGRGFILIAFAALGLAAAFQMFFFVTFAWAQELENTRERQEMAELYAQSRVFLTQMHSDPQALNKAMELLEEVKKISPDDPGLEWRLAEAKMIMAGNESDEKKSKALCEEVIVHSDKALEQNPGSVEAHFFKASAYARKAEIAGIFSAPHYLEKSKKEYYQVLKLDDKHRLGILSKSILAAMYTIPPWPLRDLDKAEPLAIEAVRQDPNLTFASKALAMLYIKQGKPSLARKELIRGLSIEEPTYAGDAHLRDWPEMRQMLKDLPK